MRKILALFLIISLLACKKELGTEPAPAVSIAWKSEQRQVSSASFIYGNNLIVFSLSDYEIGSVSALDLESGKLVWKSGEFTFSASVTPFDPSNAFLSGNKLVISYGQELYVIDADNGKELWNDRMSATPHSDMCVIGPYIYKTGRLIVGNESNLYRYDINSGQKEVVLTLTKQEHGEGTRSPLICLPVKWTDPSGNTILILANYAVPQKQGDSTQVDILAWNESADSMLWYKKGTPTKGMVTGRPLIEDDRVYFHANDAVFCVDAQSGNTLWSGNAAHNSYDENTINLVLIKNKLLVRTSGQLLAFDKMDGTLRWNKTFDHIYSPATLKEYNGTIWIGGRFLYAFDANTGEKRTEWYHTSANFWRNTLAHHPNKSMLYAGDEGFIYCLDISGMK